MRNDLVPGLVSILTPCYNTGSYLPNLLNSVLSQTYPYIEMIAVNDGSSDDTETILNSYVDKFRDKGYSLVCLKQPNFGQSVAVQNGLEYVRGEFLTWPDSDDYYAVNDAIEKMVNRLEQADSVVAMVRSQEQLVEDNTEHTPLKIIGENVKDVEDKTLFDDCLMQTNGYYYIPGAYMIRTEALFKSSAMPIYTSKKAGQNWQLMLPVLYDYRCVSIREPLYNVVQRKSSHSRYKRSVEEQCETVTVYEDTILGTIDRIKNLSLQEKEKYKKLIKIKYSIERVKLALNADNREIAQNNYRVLQNYGSVPMKLKLQYGLWRCGLFHIVKSFVRHK